jgi:hypothetical protein
MLCAACAGWVNSGVRGLALNEALQSIEAQAWPPHLGFVLAAVEN